MQNYRLVAVFGVILVTAPCAVLAEAPMSGPPPVVVKPLTSADLNSAGQPIVFPQRNGHVTAALYDIAPGYMLPVHKHPFPRLGYILAGTLRITNVESGKDAIYRAGDVILEAVGVWHKGENIGTDRLRLLVIDLSEKGEATTLFKK